MPRYLVVLFLLASACAGNNPPSEGPVGANGRRDGQAMAGDSLRRANNTVIENARPDAPARAGMIVVANQQGGNATVLDASSMRTLATLLTGTGPHEVAISPNGRWAVVTNYGDASAPGNSLTVIDLAGTVPSVARTVSLGDHRRPHGAVFYQDGAKLAVTSETTQRLVLVDVASGRVDTALATNARGSHMVTVKRDGTTAWTSNVADGTVTEFDLVNRRTVRTFPAAPDDEAIAATPGGILLWVGSNSAKTVTVFETKPATAIATLTGFGSPYRIGISRTGRVAVVSDPTSNRIWIFEVGSRKELARIDLATVPEVKKSSGGQDSSTGAGPEGITFDPIADIAYVALHGSGQVVAVDLGSFKVIGAGNVGAGPDGIGFSPLVRP